MTERNTETKEVTPTHKVAVALNGIALSYADLLGISIVLQQHSKSGEYQRLTEFDYGNLKIVQAATRIAKASAEACGCDYLPCGEESYQ